MADTPFTDRIHERRYNNMMALKPIVELYFNEVKPDGYDSYSETQQLRTFQRFWGRFLKIGTGEDATKDYHSWRQINKARRPITNSLTIQIEDLMLLEKGTLDIEDNEQFEKRKRFYLCFHYVLTSIKTNYSDLDLNDDQIVDLADFVYLQNQKLTVDTLEQGLTSLNLLPK